MNEKKKAVVMISGGMDSALVAALVKEKGYQIAALHLNYGQRTEKRELKAFNDICNHYNIKERLVVDIQYLTQIGGSSLTDDSIEVEKANLNNIDIPSSYVPFRNANILSIATSWAEVINAEAIAVGAMEQDSSGYPDCREDFFDAYEKMIDLGTKPTTKIKILRPIINMTKKEIVEKGILMELPFEITWSCYKNSDISCGECDSCALRLRGFAKAGMTDPLTYLKRIDYIK
jgi:7-cyano-7-deazaguanine synthase